MVAPGVQGCQTLTSSEPLPATSRPKRRHSPGALRICRALSASGIPDALHDVSKQGANREPQKNRAALPRRKARVAPERTPKTQSRSARAQESEPSDGAARLGFHERCAWTTVRSFEVKLSCPGRSKITSRSIISRQASRRRMPSSSRSTADTGGNLKCNDLLIWINERSRNFASSNLRKYRAHELIFIGGITAKN